MNDSDRAREWFAKIIWEEMPEEAKEEIRESRSENTDTEAQ